MNTTELAAALIRVASPSRDWNAQLRVIDMVLDRIPRSAVRVVRSEPGEAPWALATTGRVNHPMIMFVCHVDTVQVTSPEDWCVDPLSGAVVDGRLHGRGAVDMKGGLAAATHAFIRGTQIGAPVAILLTSDEEIGCLGAVSAAPSLKGLAVGAVVIPEATDNTVVLGHRGAWWTRVAVAGKAAHGSTPHLGTNAALAMAALVTRAASELPLQESTPLGAETWNLGELHAGDAPNVVPDRAVALVDHRVCGSVGDLRRWWQTQPETSQLDELLLLPPVHTRRGDPWIASLPAPFAGRPAAYFTDASVLRSLFPSVPIAIWGPGSPRHMHATNESLDLEQLNASTKLFTRAIEDWHALTSGDLR